MFLKGVHKRLHVLSVYVHYTDTRVLALYTNLLVESIRNTRTYIIDSYRYVLGRGTVILTHVISFR